MSQRTKKFRMMKRRIGRSETREFFVNSGVCEKLSNPLVPTNSSMEFLSSMARKYIWWKPAAESLRFPMAILAQVMNIGTWDDLCDLVKHFSEKQLLEILENAECGQFSPRSWHFWSHRLAGHLLPMPKRKGL